MISLESFFLIFLIFFLEFSKYQSFIIPLKNDSYELDLTHFNYGFIFYGSQFLCEPYMNHRQSFRLSAYRIA